MALERRKSGLNLEDWNFRSPNLIFTKSISSNQGWNHEKIKVLGSIKGLIEEIHS